MDESQIRTLEDVDQFLTGMTGASPQLQGSKDDGYRWIERTLVRFHYLSEGLGAALYSAAIWIFPPANGSVDRAIP